MKRGRRLDAGAPKRKGNTRTMTRTTLPFCIAAALALALPAAAADPPAGTHATMESKSSKTWHFEIIPYGWLTGVNGKASAGRFSQDFDVSFSDILDNLDIGLMGAVQARSGRWALFADFA